MRRFAGTHMVFDGIKQQFAVVNVAHDGDDRGRETSCSGIRISREAFNHVRSNPPPVSHFLSRSGRVRIDPY
jgi:hypothetical protein